MKKRLYFVLIGVSSLCAIVFFTGCSHMILLDPKGPVGDTERFVILAAFALMLIVVIPVYIMALWFPWKYRAGNTKATYSPKWSHSAKIEWIIWMVPAVIVTGLSVLVWYSTYHLDPYKPIDTAVRPLRIEAVSMDWKWLFIYPHQNIAVVNDLVFPAHVPISFKLTSTTVMTSFFIPQLGSQIYAMAGMKTRLHLLADQPGTYAGQNQQFSGRGYSEMTFKATVVSKEKFDAWIQKAKQSPDKLDWQRLEKLETPSVHYPVTYFSSVTANLFDRIVNQFGPSTVVNPEASTRKTNASEGS